jgi:hypothetical protein
MKKEIIMYPWNVHVSGFYEVGYKGMERQVETDVVVYAPDKKQAKKLAIDAAKEQNATFVFCERFKIKRKDVVKAS